MAGISAQNDANPDPSSQLGLGRTRYPNPFFDLSQQYMPPTIKELFRWCTFYYYNSPLIGSAITKISRYPITDLIFEDEHESTRELWKNIFNKDLKIKDRLMEINLDYHVYGNAFISMHLPFVRFLICKQCRHSAPINQWKWSFNGANYQFRGTCPKCNTTADAGVSDRPYKDRRGVRIIRWNPENIYVKFNEYTGRRIYMYTVPYKLKNAIQRGDKDILEDIPLIVLEALAKRRMIRFNNDNFQHLRRPTLAEQDQGWGKPLIIHVLKDMFYLYTLRRAQEAIAQEHIVPFDIIYPLPNAQQDPYMHTDLASWRVKIEELIRKHRRDPNFKGVIPIPVGFGRLGGDGKAMLLTPELNNLHQHIVGGMGIPQEFLFGGLSYTGSSITLRTLENDFVQNRSQLLDTVEWMKDKIRIWLNLPNIKTIRFADFRMADDVQRNQQLIGLNAQLKVSDQTLLTELGYNYDQEIKKMIEEVYLQNYLNDIRSKGGAKSQGEAQLIQFNYQQKIQELAAKAQADANARLGLPPPMPGEEAGAMAQPSGEVPAAAPATGGEPKTQESQPMNANPALQASDEITSKVESWAGKLSKMDPSYAAQAIQEIKIKMPELGRQVEQAYNMKKVELSGAAPGRGGRRSQESASNLGVNMNPLPTRKAPTRAETV